MIGYTYMYRKQVCIKDSHYLKLHSKREMVNVSRHASYIASWVMECKRVILEELSKTRQGYVMMGAWEYSLWTKGVTGTWWGNLPKRWWMFSLFQFFILPIWDFCLHFASWLSVNAGTSPENCCLAANIGKVERTSDWCFSFLAG